MIMIGMMLRAVVACVVAAGCISPVMKFGGGKTAKEAQHDTMAEFGPAHLVTGETWKGEVTTRKIRVWADDQLAGPRDGDWVAIKSGVAAGERVVTQGAYQVRLAATQPAAMGHGHAH